MGFDLKALHYRIFILTGNNYIFLIQMTDQMTDDDDRETPLWSLPGSSRMLKEPLVSHEALPWLVWWQPLTPYTRQENSRVYLLLAIGAVWSVSGSSWSQYLCLTQKLCYTRTTLRGIYASTTEQPHTWSWPSLPAVWLHQFHYFFGPSVSTDSLCFFNFQGHK